jgi:Tol biopolymer transport system component
MSDMVERLNAALDGRYRIERQLGEGGMATVFLAEDLKHRRNVALKVLKPELAAVVGAERFLGEIETTANLQHPHILPLFDSGEADGFLFYVMPFIEGESLRERLEREQQLPVEDALGIAEKVAAALQYAHEQGVVHRDIKPANILMSRGEPLVADFGIALALSEAGGGRITETGLSLGTPHYMSPEQAAGERTLDKRSDVYALGCVVYEMLTGQPPFGGPSAQAVLARILTGEADRITLHRRSVPPNVEAAVSHALERLPADRFDSAAAFARALRDPSYGAERRAAGVAAGARGGGGRWRLAAIAAAIVAVASVAVSFTVTRPGDPPPVRRYSMELAGDAVSPSLVGSRIDISPDGSTVAFIGLGGSGQAGATQIWIRRRDELEARPLGRTEISSMPTFSPDGQRIAYGTGNARFGIASLGGEPPVVFDAPGNQTFGLDWGSDGNLYYAGLDGIYRIPAGGGDAERVTRVDTAGGEFLHVYPELLPGGRGLIYTSVRNVGSDPDASRVQVVELESGEIRTSIRALQGRYARAGYLLLVSSSPERTLLAVPFDLRRLEVTGEAVALAQGIGVTTNGVDMALSDDGTLIYLSAPSDEGNAITPMIVARDGTQRPVDPTWREAFSSLAVAPAGDQVALSFIGQEGEHIWVKNLDGSPPAKRTFEGQQNQRPEYTPDGRTLVYYNNQGGGFDLWRVPADGSGRAEVFVDEARDVVAAEFTPDGRWIIFRTNALQSPGADILARRIGADGTPEGEVVPLLATAAGERTPAVSPDGRWMAYVSDESGRDEVYVRPFPDVQSARWQVSVNGATEPLWSRSGDELFYRRSDGMLMAVSVRTDPAFVAGRREPLFEATAYFNDYNHRGYDVFPGDSTFLMLPIDQTGGTHAVVVDNLFTELREKVGG